MNDDEDLTRCECCGKDYEGRGNCDHGYDLCDQCDRVYCQHCAREHADEMRVFMATGGRLP